MKQLIDYKFSDLSWCESPVPILLLANRRATQAENYLAAKRMGRHTFRVSSVVFYYHVAELQR
jgi:hypothetical protein